MPCPLSIAVEDRIDDSGATAGCKQRVAKAQQTPCWHTVFDDCRATIRSVVTDHTKEQRDIFSWQSMKPVKYLLDCVSHSPLTRLPVGQASDPCASPACPLPRLHTPQAPQQWPPTIQETKETGMQNSFQAAQSRKLHAWRGKQAGTR